MSKAKAYDVQVIEVPEGLYPRASMPTEKDVEHLIGVNYPPIVIAELVESQDPARPEVMTETGRIVLVDGAHRLTAAQLEGTGKVMAESLGELTAEEVLREAITRNATHGKQLSMKDKEKLAKAYAAQSWKPKDIVALLAVGERTVGRWIADVAEETKLKQWAKAEKLLAKGASQSSVAKELGVPRSTLAGWQKNPPEAKERAPKAEPIQPVEHDVDGATKILGAGRIRSIAEAIVEFAKDSSKELSNSVADGEDYPHWTELCEAAIKAIRASYPKEWRV